MTPLERELFNSLTKLENRNYTSWFYCPDSNTPSGGIGLLYDHVRVMNECGFTAFVLHFQNGFVPNWLGDRAIGAPVRYIESGGISIQSEDFLFIPEVMTRLMKTSAQGNPLCKRIVFCQNWFYVLNSLPLAESWQTYGINDCMSVSSAQTEYLQMIMPGLNIKQIVGSVSRNAFKPPQRKTEKKPVIAYIPSRDDGQKSYNVLQTFYCLYPNLKFIATKEIRNMNNKAYQTCLREAAFYVHFDEFSSWGTAPIEAFLSGCLVAGWDGMGGREYMKPIVCEVGTQQALRGNTWLAPNGDIVALALQIGNMISAWSMNIISDQVYRDMETATRAYSVESEKNSILKAHGEWRDERIAELRERIN